MLAVQLLAGLVLLVLGAEWLVRGATRLALAAKVTPLVIGLTVVAFGTSTPELVTSVIASSQGQQGISLGNIIGSNIVNLGLILGIGACLRALPVQSMLVRRDLPMMGLATVGFALLVWFTALNPVTGAFLVLGIIGYTAWQIRASRTETAAIQAEFDAEITGRDWSLGKAVGFTVLGLGGLIFGADWLVKGAVALATQFGISERVIGLTIVAIGTSLPEAATTWLAVWRNEPDVAVGNIVGSNIFNILMIGGVVGLFGPIAAQPAGGAVDLYVLMTITLISGGLLYTKNQLERWEGALLAVGYLAYLGWLISSG